MGGQPGGGGRARPHACGPVAPRQPASQPTPAPPSPGPRPSPQVWDYQTKACIQTLDGHSHNVSACAFHPELPLILTGSEDGTVKMWHR